MKPRRSTIVLGAALVLSLAAAAVLARTAFRFRAEEEAVRLDPVGASVYAGASVALPAAGRVRVVLFGDSRALMWQPAAREPYEFVGRGIWQQTTEQIVERFERDVTPLRPAILVVEMGVNDLKAIPVFPERTDAIVDQCRKDIDEVVRRGRAMGATVVLVTVFPLGDVSLARRLFWSGDVARSIRQVNEHIRGLAGDRVLVLDADAVLDDGSGRVKSEYQFDMLHLNPAGYAALDPVLAKTLDAAPR